MDIPILKGSVLSLTCTSHNMACNMEADISSIVCIQSWKILAKTSWKILNWKNLKLKVGSNSHNQIS